MSPNCLAFAVPAGVDTSIASRRLRRNWDGDGMTDDECDHQDVGNHVIHDLRPA